MPTSPLVTVGLPVYNSERFVRESFESLLGQTFTDFILVVSDNASTDGTAEICQDYAKRDPRVRYHRNPENIGNPRNFNRIVALTDTPYLKWSTSDDLWEPTFLEKAVAVMEADTGIALCYPKSWVVDTTNGIQEPYEDNLHLVQEDPVARFFGVLDRIKLAHQHLGLIRMECLRRTHLLGVHVGSDINLISELSLYGKFFELPDRLFHRRFHDRSGSWKRGDEKHEAAFYHAARSRRTRFQSWNTHLGHFRSIHAAPLRAGARWSAYRRLLQRAVWDWKNLVRELSSFLRPRAKA